MKQDEGSDVFRGHGREYKNKSEATTNPDWPGDKAYAVRVETKVGLASVQRKKGREQQRKGYICVNLAL